MYVSFPCVQPCCELLYSFISTFTYTSKQHPIIELVTALTPFEYSATQTYSVVEPVYQRPSERKEKHMLAAYCRTASDQLTT